MRCCVQAVDLAVRAAVEVSRASEGHAPAAVVRLTGVLHWEEQHALKAVARQLCTELERPFVASASFEENLNFFHDVLRSVSQCGARSRPVFTRFAAVCCELCRVSQLLTFEGMPRIRARASDAEGALA